MSSDSREDYLINILRLSEEGETVRTSKLASFMNVAPASVTEMIKILSDSGYVEYEKYRGVKLTEEGLKYARSIRRKHHVMERFLTEILDKDHKEAHEEACLMEHSVSDESVDKLCRIIGTKISEDCSTCTNPCNNNTETINISDLKVGESKKISYLKSGDSNKIKKLLSMGFIPGRTVKLESIQNNGPRVLELDDVSFVLDKELSEIICLEI